MPEKTLQATVMEMAKVFGWLAYHVLDSRKTPPGFPDCVLVHPDRGILWRELKTAAGKVTPDQRKWLDTLTAAGADAGRVAVGQGRDEIVGSRRPRRRLDRRVADVGTADRDVGPQRVVEQDGVLAHDADRPA